LAAILALLIALATGSPADAKPHFVDAFDLSGTPGQIARGPDGNIWVTISGSSQNNTLARVQPNGTVTEFAPAAVVNPVGITAGPDGNLWLTRNGGVIKVPPADPDSAQDFDIAAITQPQTIRPAARGIAASSGHLWIADFGGGRIVRSTPAGDTTFFDVGGGPQQVAGSPGKQVAYGNPGDNPQTVGRIRPGGSPKETKVPMSDPFGIAFAPDGNWWFAEFAKHALGLLSSGGKVEQFNGLPDNSGPRYLAVGPKGTVWVSLELANKVALIKGVAPQTRITKGPDSPVEVPRGKADVKFRFRSGTPKASFECALKHGGHGDFKRCDSPKGYHLGPSGRGATRSWFGRRAWGSRTPRRPGTRSRSFAAERLFGSSAQLRRSRAPMSSASEPTTWLASRSASSGGGNAGLGIAIARIPAACAERSPLAESSIAAHPLGSSPRRAEASR
jgi:virginiamycin B lyase